MGKALEDRSGRLPWPSSGLGASAPSVPGLHFLPKGSNVVPFGVCYGFVVRDYTILPKKELHRRVWVGTPAQKKGLEFVGFRVQGLGFGV